MSKTVTNTSRRKKEHIELCLTDKVAYKNKTNGFEHYEFVHDALTEVDISKISFKTEIFSKKVDYPFLISCMTGGTSEANNINKLLASVAENLKIALGVGSQRQALEDSKHHNSYNVIRKTAANIPVFGNIGAAQIVQSKDFSEIIFLIEMLEADAFVIHLNPLQELIQPEGEPHFTGLLKKIEQLVLKADVPLIVKEVGSGISKTAAVKLLEAGVKGIDVAGSGGTSWAGVEMLRNGEKSNTDFWDWGLPTSFCIKENYSLKSKYDFILFGSGGINTARDMAVAYALGADFTASARIILQKIMKNGENSVIKLILDWFEYLKRVMFLTGSSDLKQLKQNKLILKEKMF